MAISFEDIQESKNFEGKTPRQIIENNEDIPKLTGNIIDIIGNSFAALCHAGKNGNLEMVNDIRRTRKGLIKRLIPAEIKNFHPWCQFKHKCSILINTMEQASKLKGNGQKIDETAFNEDMQRLLRLLKITWIKMFVSSEQL